MRPSLAYVLMHARSPLAYVLMYALPFFKLDQHQDGSTFLFPS
jgi:hypothetical protein